MTNHVWQRYMLEAENALGAGALGAAICLYQQALAEVYELVERRSGRTGQHAGGHLPSACRLLARHGGARL